MRRVSRPLHQAPAHQGELPLVNVSQPRPISAPDGFRSFQGPPVAVRARRPAPSSYLPVGYRRQLPNPGYSYHASYYGSQDAHTASQPYQQEELRYDTQEEFMGPPAEAYGPSQYVQADTTPRDRPSQTSGSAITLSQAPVAATTTGEDTINHHAEVKERLEGMDHRIDELREGFTKMTSALEQLQQGVKEITTKCGEGIPALMNDQHKETTKLVSMSLTLVRQQDSSVGALRSAMFKMLSEHDACIRESLRELPQLLSSATADVTLGLQNLSRIMLEANDTRTATRTESQPQQQAAPLVQDQLDNHQASLALAPVSQPARKRQTVQQAALSVRKVQTGQLPNPARQPRGAGRTVTHSPPLAQRKSARHTKAPARFAEADDAEPVKPANRRNSRPKKAKDDAGRDGLQGGAYSTPAQAASAHGTCASVKAVARRKVSFELPDDSHANSPCSPKHERSAKKHKPSVSASAGSTMLEVADADGPHASQPLARSVRRLEFNSPSSSQSTTTSSAAFDPCTAPLDDDEESVHIQQRLMRARMKRQKRFLASGLLSSSQNTFVQAVINMQLQHNSPMTS